MVWITSEKRGTRGGKLSIRVTPYGEVGIIEEAIPETSVYWRLEDTDRIIEEIKKAIEEHKKEKMKEV